MKIALPPNQKPTFKALSRRIMLSSPFSLFSIASDIDPLFWITAVTGAAAGGIASAAVATYETLLAPSLPVCVLEYTCCDTW